MEKTPIRVMVVEDEPSFKELVQFMLSLDPRFQVVATAATGEEALEKFALNCPDLVLLDFRLPGMDGIEAAKHMKARCPDVRIIMVTAYTQEVLARLAKQAQIQEVIPKATFSLERVLQALDG